MRSWAAASKLSFCTNEANSPSKHFSSDHLRLCLKSVNFLENPNSHKQPMPSYETNLSVLTANINVFLTLFLKFESQNRYLPTASSSSVIEWVNLFCINQHLLFVSVVARSNDLLMKRIVIAKACTRSRYKHMFQMLLELSQKLQSVHNASIIFCSQFSVINNSNHLDLLRKHH